ncbi:lin 52 [Echinococcus multilocularis]|uniref:Lin 52 n=1 Tax=Echinococcus multilocularis TaxID=6211 RepID=A0A068YFL1_ECHMU|nr:lin 52 [Echinococcus multilocularis]
MEDQELASNENLDRASPELWPDQSVSEFISTRQPDLNIQTPSKYRTDLDKEDLELIHGNQRNGSWEILEYIGETLNRIGTIFYALYTIQMLNTHFDCTNLPPLWPSSFHLVPD